MCLIHIYSPLPCVWKICNPVPFCYFFILCVCRHYSVQPVMTNVLTCACLPFPVYYYTGGLWPIYYSSVSLWCPQEGDMPLLHYCNHLPTDHVHTTPHLPCALLATLYHLYIPCHALTTRLYMPFFLTSVKRNYCIHQKHGGSLPCLRPAFQRREKEEEAENLHCLYHTRRAQHYYLPRKATFYHTFC